MSWCLTWWSPEGWVQGLIALLFWGGVAGSVAWIWLRRRQRRHAQVAAGTHDVRPEADGTTEQAPRVGARGGSTR